MRSTSDDPGVHTAGVVGRSAPRLGVQGYAAGHIRAVL
jgi:hypothetical protein